LKFSWSHQLPVDAANDNLLGGHTHDVNKNTVTLSNADKEMKPLELRQSSNIWENRNKSELCL
jgi:hypothetical protein